MCREGLTWDLPQRELLALSSVLQVLICVAGSCCRQWVMFNSNAVYKEVRQKWFWPERCGKGPLTVCSNNIFISDFSLNSLCFWLLKGIKVRIFHRLYFSLLLKYKNWGSFIIHNPFYYMTHTIFLTHAFPLSGWGVFKVVLHYQCGGAGFHPGEICSCYF